MAPVRLHKLNKPYIALNFCLLFQRGFFSPVLSKIILYTFCILWWKPVQPQQLSISNSLKIL